MQLVNGTEQESQEKASDVLHKEHDDKMLHFKLIFIVA